MSHIGQRSCEEHSIRPFVRHRFKFAATAACSEKIAKTCPSLTAELSPALKVSPLTSLEIWQLLKHCRVAWAQEMISAGLTWDDMGLRRKCRQSKLGFANTRSSSLSWAAPGQKCCSCCRRCAASVWSPTSSHTTPVPEIAISLFACWFLKHSEVSSPCLSQMSHNSHVTVRQIWPMHSAQARYSCMRPELHVAAVIGFATGDEEGRAAT